MTRFPGMYSWLDSDKVPSCFDTFIPPHTAARQAHTGVLGGYLPHVSQIRMPCAVWICCNSLQSSVHARSPGFACGILTRPVALSLPSVDTCSLSLSLSRRIWLPLSVSLALWRPCSLPPLHPPCILGTLPCMLGTLTVTLSPSLSPSLSPTLSLTHSLSPSLSPTRSLTHSMFPFLPSFHVSLPVSLPVSVSAGARGTTSLRTR